MRITEAAQALGTSPRMLRYREALGLLPPVRRPESRAPGQVTAQARHRRFTDDDLAAVSVGLAIERRYRIGPAELAFGIRVLADPRVRADVAELGRRIAAIQAPPVRAIDFEKERALRLLGSPVAETTGIRRRPPP